MWILTKLYGLFSPAPIEERPPIISVGAELRLFGNPGEKNCLSFKKTFKFSFIHVDVKQLSRYRVLRCFYVKELAEVRTGHDKHKRSNRWALPYWFFTSQQENILKNLAM